MEETGTLIVQVTTSRARLPVAGATVVVTTPAADEKHELISITETDESGLSGPIRLKVPASADGGQTPGGPTPFSMYSLWVEHPDYTLSYVENFQIFPGIESVQQISLVPLSGQNPDHSEINGGINATPQPL